MQQAIQGRKFGARALFGLKVIENAHMYVS